MENISLTTLKIIAVTLIINAILISFVSVINAGVVLTFVIGIILLLYAIYFKQAILSAKKGFFLWIKYFVLISFFYITLSTIFLAFYGSIDTVTYTEDAVIVLGAGINGEEPSMSLKRRLEKATEYYYQNSEAVIVVSGGMGVNENITEASAMEQYLLGKNIPQNKIIKEEKATSTYENFIYSKEILDIFFEQPYKIAIITNDFHIYRATQLAKITQFPMPSHYHAKTDWYSIPTNYVRECVAIVKLWIFKR